MNSSVENFAISVNNQIEFLKICIINVNLLKKNICAINDQDYI